MFKFYTFNFPWSGDELEYKKFYIEENGKLSLIFSFDNNKISTEFKYNDVNPNEPFIMDVKEITEEEFLKNLNLCFENIISSFNNPEENILNNKIQQGIIKSESTLEIPKGEGLYKKITKSTRKKLTNKYVGLVDEIPSHLEEKLIEDLKIARKNIQNQSSYANTVSNITYRNFSDNKETQYISGIDPVNEKIPLEPLKDDLYEFKENKDDFEWLLSKNRFTVNINKADFLDSNNDEK